MRRIQRVARKFSRYCVSGQLLDLIEGAVQNTHLTLKISGQQFTADRNH